MSIHKFKQFEKYENAYQSNDFTELEEIWSIICDLNVQGFTFIKIFKYWCDKDIELNSTKTLGQILVNSAISSSSGFLKLDKLYSINIQVYKNIFKNIDQYSDFSDDFFVACDRLKDIGDVIIDIGDNREDGRNLEYQILLKVKRK